MWGAQGGRQMEAAPVGLSHIRFTWRERIRILLIGRGQRCGEEKRVRTERTDTGIYPQVEPTQHEAFFFLTMYPYPS